MRNTTQTFTAVLEAGKDKALYPISKHFILSLMAGAYIGFGAALSVKVTGNLSPDLGNLTKLIFGLLFPVGLLLVIMAGASLFTGELMYMSASSFKKETSLSKTLRFLCLSYIGNFIGSIVLAYLVYAAGVMMDASGSLYPVAETAVKLANSKTSLSFIEAFVRGILCNWLVCLAIFMSLTSDDAVSKAVLIWPPITAFVALGMEHSVANMFFIPLGIFLGHSQEVVLSGVKLTATYKSFLIDNLVPVTLGNIVGGVIFVTLPYCVASGKHFRKNTA
jgi:formate/nitrite transporter